MGLSEGRAAPQNVVIRTAVTAPMNEQISVTSFVRRLPNYPALRCQSCTYQITLLNITESIFKLHSLTFYVQIRYELALVPNSYVSQKKEGQNKFHSLCWSEWLKLSYPMMLASWRRVPLSPNSERLPPPPPPSWKPPWPSISLNEGPSNNGRSRARMKAYIYNNE